MCEIRNPKAEIRMKSEGRNPKPEVSRAKRKVKNPAAEDQAMARRRCSDAGHALQCRSVRISSFGFRNSFGFRPSDFGFHTLDFGLWTLDVGVWTSDEAL